MQKGIFFSAAAVVLILSGCVGTTRQDNGDTASTTSQEYGGVLRSGDSGKTFEPRNAIDGGGSIARMDVLALVADPVDTQILYVGTASNGIYTSQNSGETWTRIDFGPTYTPVLLINPRHTKTLYASGVFDKRGRLFRSDDGGATWRDIYVEPVEGTVVLSATLSPQDPETIYLGTSESKEGYATIARSADGGKTWTNLYTSEASVTKLAFDATDTQTLYAYLDSNELIRSRDGGTTWENLNDVARAQEDGVFFEGTLYSFVPDLRDSGVIYAGTDQGLYRSDDYGVTWTPEDIIGSSKGLAIRGLAVSPEGAGLTYVAGQAVYVRAFDNSAWAITDTRSDRNVNVVIYDPHDARIQYLGLYRIKKGLFE